MEQVYGLQKIEISVNVLSIQFLNNCLLEIGTANISCSQSQKDAQQCRSLFSVEIFYPLHCDWSDDCMETLIIRKIVVSNMLKYSCNVSIGKVLKVFLLKSVHTLINADKILQLLAYQICSRRCPEILRGIWQFFGTTILFCLSGAEQKYLPLVHKDLVNLCSIQRILIQNKIKKIMQKDSRRPPKCPSYIRDPYLLINNTLAIMCLSFTLSLLLEVLLFSNLFSIPLSIKNQKHTKDKHTDNYHNHQFLLKSCFFISNQS